MSSAIPAGVMAYDNFFKFIFDSIIQPRSTKRLRTAFMRPMDIPEFSAKRRRLASGSFSNVFAMLCKVSTSLFII